MTRSDWKGCARKRRYRDPREAKENKHAAANARGTRLRVYPCPRCGGYHLTRQGAR